MIMNPDKIIQLVHETRPLIMNTENARKITVKGQADFVTRVDTVRHGFSIPLTGPRI